MDNSLIEPVIEPVIAKKKPGRKTGSTLSYAVCHNPEKLRERQKIKNKQFMTTAGYIKTKIKMNCKKHNIPIPDMDGLEKPELTELLNEIKIARFMKSL